MEVMLNTKKLQKSAVSGLLFIAIAASLYATFLHPFVIAPRNRKALLELGAHVELGDSQEDVLDDFAIAERRSQIRWRKCDSSTWGFETPSQFGAGNWILVVSFDGEIVDAVGFRTADSPKGKPLKAPEDRVREASIDRWKSRYGPDWIR